jgi:hypothetical protein
MKSNYNLLKGIIVFVLCLQWSEVKAQTKQPISVEEYTKKQNTAIERLLKEGHPRFIKQRNGENAELVGELETGKPMYLITHNNVDVVNALDANLYDNPFDGFSIDGTGVKIAMIDAGFPRRFHDLFRISNNNTISSRINNITNSFEILDNIFGDSSTSHPTHMAGTAIGFKNFNLIQSPTNEQVRGVAIKSTLDAYHWNAHSLKTRYIAEANTTNILNKSFGVILQNEPATFGRYNDLAFIADDVMCKYPTFQIVKSVGNERIAVNGIVTHDQQTILGGYDLLESEGIAKNVLVVGAVDLNCKSQTSPCQPPFITENIGTSFSSYGPTDDGRIKPDVVTHGYQVKSSTTIGSVNSNTSYEIKNGTSTAAAGISGGIALLHQYWNLKWNTNPSVNNTMWSSTVRALLIHNVDEIDAPGPDYRHGWGVANIRKAAETIKNRGRKDLIIQNKICNQDTIRINLAATGLEDLKITLAWTDPAGVVTPTTDSNNQLLPGVTNEILAKLVNDLDIRLIRRNETGADVPLMFNGQDLRFPWILKSQIQGETANSLGEIATRGDNTRDNVEKIEVYNGAFPLTNGFPNTGGVFQLVISHKNPITVSCGECQNYSLIVSGISTCDDNLMFTQHQDNEIGTDGVGHLVLAKTIKASNIIREITFTTLTEYDDEFVEYKAADFIELLPQLPPQGQVGDGSEGFTSEGGSNFLAHIGCNYDGRISFSKEEITAIISDPSPFSIKNIEIKKGEMIAFPNPVINDILHLQFSLIDDSNVTIQLFDLQGKLLYIDNDSKIFEKGTHKKSIDMVRYPAGTYIIHATTNNETFQMKIIKK